MTCAALPAAAACECVSYGVLPLFVNTLGALLSPFPLFSHTLFAAQPLDSPCAAPSALTPCEPNPFKPPLAVSLF